VRDETTSGHDAWCRSRREAQVLGRHQEKPLLKAAELGYITELTCGMPECFCPEELGGPDWFAPRSDTWDDWEPTFHYFPIPKRDGGKATPENAILAHRICNKLDYSISEGHPIDKLLARIEAARESASQSG
jgi:hypothetical protein